MVIQQAHQFGRVEESGGISAGKRLSHLLEIGLLAQPAHHGHRKAQLLFLRPIAGNGTLSSLSQRDLRLPLAYLLRRGNGSRQTEHLAVEEGHTRFKRMRHRHLVGFQQDIADEPEPQIHVLHARRLVVLRNLGIYGRRQLLRGGNAHDGSLVYSQHSNRTAGSARMHGMR